MPRSPRIDFPNARHHVMNRGARHEPIFRTDEDCLRFLDVLALTVERLGVIVHSYALMGNHYHLQLSTPRANLSEAIGFLQSRFSHQQNLIHNWDGPLFRGRFRNHVAENDEYWRYLLAYIHLNPVAAHLVTRPEDAVWTSHRAYVGLERPAPWLETDSLTSLFGGAKSIAEYVWSVHVGRQPAPESFDPSQLWRPSRPEAEPAFSQPVPHMPRVTADRALAEVAQVTGCAPEALMQGVRGPNGNPRRRLAMWWMHSAAGLGTNEIARFFSVNPALVSRAIGGAQRDDAMSAWRDALTSRRASSPN